MPGVLLAIVGFTVFMLCFRVMLPGSGKRRKP
jgi:hypothetical protein